MPRSEFERHFEGASVLDELLSLAGSALDAHEVLARFVAGHQAGEPANAVIPTLFDEEPRFPDAQLAQRLYQNLFGLWDLVVSGRKVELHPTERPKPQRRQKPVPPPPFTDEPDAAFVEAAWQWLEELPEGDGRTLERLTHAFENREDALLQWLDEANLPDDAYEAARYLLFESFAMLEVGWAPGLRAISRTDLNVAPADGAGVPAALLTYADEALSESELEDEAAVRAIVNRGLWALWKARRP